MGQFLSIVIILEITVYSSIWEEVYETLKSMKREEESINDAVERRINKKREANLEEFFGVLEDSEMLNGLEEDTKRIRASSRFRI